MSQAFHFFDGPIAIWDTGEARFVDTILEFCSSVLEIHVEASASTSAADLRWPCLLLWSKQVSRLEKSWCRQEMYHMNVSLLVNKYWVFLELRFATAEIYFFGIFRLFVRLFHVELLFLLQSHSQKMVFMMASLHRWSRKWMVEYILL